MSNFNIPNYKDSSYIRFHQRNQVDLANIPFLTIITVCLNNFDGLLKTRESIQKQIFQDWEHIVIDGGSKDGTVEYLSTSDVDYWVSEPDQGISDAFNKGICASKGKYLLFLNSGDTLIFPQALNILCDHAVKPIITTQVACGNHTIPRFIPKVTQPLYIKSFLAHQGSLIRRDVFANYGLYSLDLKVRMDYEFWMRVLSQIDFEYRSDIVISFEPIGKSNQDFLRYHREEKIINQKYSPSLGCWSWYFFRKLLKQIKQLKKR
jgi:glycosyltransferase involved in cell wall biosynthesis